MVELLPEVQALAPGDLKPYIRKRAERIVRDTQGSSWDDPEDWQSEAVELAHAVYRLLWFQQGREDGYDRQP